MQPLVEVEIALERLSFEAGGFCPRMLFSGVDGIGRGFGFGVF